MPAPLWGIGHTAGVSGVESYLHDGRARTLSEAILWHGGEGETAKNAFVAQFSQQKIDCERQLSRRENFLAHRGENLLCWHIHFKPLGERPKEVGLLDVFLAA